jgi:rubrerythrin
MPPIDLPNDQIRRELREIDDLQQSSLPGFRSALRRLFGDAGHTEAEQSAAVIGGLSRRNVLRIGGVTLLGGAVMAACGSSGTKVTSTTAGAATSLAPITGAPTTAGATTTAAAMAAGGDALILRTASSIEELAVAAYQIAIDSGLVKTAAIADAAKLFQAQHKEHSALFQAQTKAAGGAPFTQPNPAILAAIKPTIDALKDEMGIVALAFDLETVAAQTYQANVGTFTDLKLNAAIMTVGGVEARHAAVLAGVLKQGQVPKAFQVTDKATKPGTGV